MTNDNRTSITWYIHVADSLQLAADASARRRLRSTDTMTLQVPSPPSATDRPTDQASPVAAAGSSLQQSTTGDDSRQLTAAVSARDKGTSLPVSRSWTDQKPMP